MHEPGDLLTSLFLLLVELMCLVRHILQVAFELFVFRLELGQLGLTI